MLVSGAYFWFIVICWGKLLGRVDLRVDHRHFGNYMKIQEVPKADDPARRSRIGSGPRLCIKLGICGGLSQSTLSSQRDSRLTVTFCRKSRPIKMGDFFEYFTGHARGLVFVSSVNFVRD